MAAPLPGLTQALGRMDSSSQISEEESWHLAYGVFVCTLEALASPAEEACKVMGYVNTAWELRDDGLAGSYLLGRGYFSHDQEREIRTFLEQLDTVPVNDMPSGWSMEPNLSAMRHPAWEPIRVSARALLASLALVTRESHAYIESLGNAP